LGGNFLVFAQGKLVAGAGRATYSNNLKLESCSHLQILKNMSFVLRSQLVAVLVSALGWAAPASAQTTLAAAPAPDALASASHFTDLCEAKLKLAPAQATSLHTYLDQEVNHLHVLAQNGLLGENPTLAATEADQLDAVVAKLLSPGQLHDFDKLRQTPQAQGYLRSMALLPTTPDNAAKNKQRQRRNTPMVAQRLDEVE
jgi:hypothetical protein